VAASWKIIDFGARHDFIDPRKSATAKTASHLDAPQARSTMKARAHLPRHLAQRPWC